MTIIENENISYFDVDDTLILYPHDISSEEALKLGYKYFTDIYSNESFLAKPSEAHIKLLKSYRERGFFNIVHSGAGYRHAESIIRQLGLEEYVDQIQTKPMRYIDDLISDKWMGTHLYLEKK